MMPSGNAGLSFLCDMTALTLCLQGSNIRWLFQLGPTLFPPVSLKTFSKLP